MYAVHPTEYHRYEMYTFGRDAVIRMYILLCTLSIMFCVCLRVCVHLVYDMSIYMPVSGGRAVKGLGSTAVTKSWDD